MERRRAPSRTNKVSFSRKSSRERVCKGERNKHPITTAMMTTTTPARATTTATTATPTTPRRKKQGWGARKVPRQKKSRSSKWKHMRMKRVARLRQSRWALLPKMEAWFKKPGPANKAWPIQRRRMHCACPLANTLGDCVEPEVRRQLHWWQRAIIANWTLAHMLFFYLNILTASRQWKVAMHGRAGGDLRHECHSTNHEKMRRAESNIFVTLQTLSICARSTSQSVTRGMNARLLAAQSMQLPFFMTLNDSEISIHKEHP